ncbi:PREDICTED: uncharacterized protein MAL13P1.304-like [Papilio polytes]|uniref:uncharacterized protein MAL13P1.304-like n=1 Tax=Papilio polytes TaxID=76194 RepID=UPI000675D98C|nr:PREDICTED: uncharacterized protein MAL13P1.304-like [Papilio polytes]
MTSVQELSCIFCKESFEDKESLQTHFRKHGDPTFNKTTKSKLRVQNNSPTSSDTSRDDVEMVSCDVCDEVFPSISKAITHKHKVHPDYDAKYFCPWCGKLFTLKFLYNKHLESSHESMPKVTNCFHCDCCDVDFFLPCAMVYHNKFYHRQEKDATSIGFSKKVKFLCQELVQIYYCPFCGEEYENKVNLNKHMEDDHSDENQCPEDVLRCPLCEAVFYHLDAYELHLTFHSSEDLYSEENEMLKQIVEFSLDTVPPLVEKLEIPSMPEDDDANAIGVDQFLQLSMSKDIDEQPDHTEKVKSKKHKKHKKSKKAITLDEFLNMNTDLFGEGLNIQGIEEVPTRVITKHLKPKKDPVLKNLKNKPLPTNIDKLQKQGITIKMKSGNKIVPSKVQQPVSTTQSTPKKSNVISTSSEVLSRLMNQSNNQIKIVKKPAANNTNVDLDTNENESIIMSKSEETHDVKENEEMSVAKENISADNTEDSTTKVDLDKVKEENPPDIEAIHDKEIIKSPLLTETTSNTLDEKTLNISSDHSHEMKETKSFDANRNDKNKIRKQGVGTENPPSILNTNDNINLEERETLNDFEESLIATKIPCNEIIKKESQNGGTKKSNSEKNESIVDQKEKTNNTLNAIKHLSHLITVKPVVQSKPGPSKERETNNETSHNKVEDLNNEIKDEDEDDDEEDNIPISKLDNLKDNKPKALDPLKNLSKHVTIKSLTSQVSTSKLDQFNDDSNDSDNADELSNHELDNKSLKNNVVGKKVVNLDNRNKAEAKIKKSQTDSPKQETSKKLNVKKTQENNSESNSTIDNTKINTSNADLLKRLTNVTAKSISSKLPIKQQPSPQTLEQSTNVKKENFTERVKMHGKIDEEIEIFNIDDSDSDDQNEPEDNKVKNTKLPIKSASENKETKATPAPKSVQALRNLGKNITVKSNTQATVTSIKVEENISDENKTFSEEEEDYDQTDEGHDTSLSDFIDESHKMLQSTLKNLSKNLTVKTKSSPKLPNTRKREFSRQQNERFSNNDSDSDTEYAVGKVKITEITDHNSGDEFLSADESKNFVQSPNCNNSDDDDNFAEDENQHFSEDDNDGHQINAKMKSNEHPNQAPSPGTSLRHTATTQQKCDKSPLDKFKKLNKDITIRSLNENKRTNRNAENEEDNTSKDSNNSNNTNKEFASKPYKQNVTKLKSEHQSTSSATNEKVGSNQVSTVNKEVSVKTYQSQTVIEEITTTVTKTIRTVNQTVKQEVNNTQVNTNPTFRPQKIPNFNPSKVIHKPVVVRNSTPNVGTKVVKMASSNPTTSGIRPTNQLVPVRANTAKVGNFKAPVAKNVTTTPQIPVACRTLKISPQVMKRPSQDTQGQFSCFKKPKESVMEMQKSREQEGEMHMTATQSKSDFTSTVKSMKGKTLVTSTQMKSEMSASAHLSKIGNMSGLKIVKTSSKQSTQVEEKVESSNAKRTMEALQKLQMQGLLVKRPRTEEDKMEEDNEFSNSGSENDDDT